MRNVLGRIVTEYELFKNKLPGMIDLRCVKADNTLEEKEEMAEVAVKLQCALM